MSKVRKVSLAKLDEFFSAIAHSERLYLPVDTTAGAEYKEWAEGTKWSDALNTVRSAKDFFFPQTENLMDFKMQDKKIELIDTRRETEDFVVFGVRACDARAFRVLDNVFLAEPVDTYYQNRRKHGTIVTVACTRPVETCFCGTFDIDPANADGDVNAYKAEDALYLQAVTEKGEKLLETLASVTEDADEKPVEEQKALIKERMAKLPLAELRPDAFGKDKTSEFFNAPEWKDLYQACLGCGTCTFVCPTCQCFNISDEGDPLEGRRLRSWDNCMSPLFTREASGHNPRTAKALRMRNRVSHKYWYAPDYSDGRFACTGCGRCIKQCPVSLDIREIVLNAIADDAEAK